MPISQEAEVFLRARTLGFHSPRPGTRPSPRDFEATDFSLPEIRQALEVMRLGEATVTSVTRCVSRRRVALVRFADQMPIVCKWPDPDPELDNDYEWVFLGIMAGLDLPQLVRDSVPTVIGGGPHTRVIALDAVDPCTSLRDLSTAYPVLPTRHLASLGSTLAKLHAIDVTDAYREYSEWLLMLPVPSRCNLTLEEYSHGCGLDFESYLEVMQRLEPVFARMHAEWKPRSIVHYDLRDDNVLFFGSPAAPRVRLIDWEMAGFGEPAYDVGYLMAQLLMPWLRAQASGDHNPKGFQAAMRNVSVFFEAYTSHSEPDDDLAERAALHAGIALLVHASMRLQQLGALGRFGHACLLLAEHLLLQPGALLLRGAEPQGRRPRKGEVYV